ncbi:MAG TPA: alpha/beta hydrolase, partial [Terrimicrobiaceae bacterium]|nr:alpha/beta hydrolase [Terrimicrobiaceae bacterium]
MDREPFSRLKSLVNFLLIVPLGYLVACAVLYFRQDSMIFVPDRGTEAEQDPLADAEGFEPWTNARGERIGWKSRDGDDANVLLVFSGNGGYALRRTYYREFCRKNAGNWRTFLLEYPGYGFRPGQPSESSLTAAAVEALDGLSASPGRKIRVLGVSLGSGVACAAVSRRPQA